MRRFMRGWVAMTQHNHDLAIKKRAPRPRTLCGGEKVQGLNLWCRCLRSSPRLPLRVRLSFLPGVLPREPTLANFASPPTSLSRRIVQCKRRRPGRRPIWVAVPTVACMFGVHRKSSGNRMSFAQGWQTGRSSDSRATIFAIRKGTKGILFCSKKMGFQAKPSADVRSCGSRFGMLACGSAAIFVRTGQCVGHL